MGLFKKSEKTDEEILAVFPEEIYRSGELELKDVLSPSAFEVNPTYIRLGAKLARTLFIFSYPRYLHTNWFSPIINMDRVFDISMYIHPVDTGSMLKTLRRKVVQVQSQIASRQEKGLVRDPILDTAYRDLEDLRDKLQQATERIFSFGLYLTLYGTSEDELNKVESEIKSVLESRLVYVKAALFQQSEAFQSILPLNVDKLEINNFLNSAPVSSTFPFVSFDLTSNKGILYGINRHNNGLILFDRFSLPNYNSVVFGTAGGGKSIGGSEPVLVRRNGKIELTPIGNLIDLLIETRGINYRDEELEGVSNPSLEVWSFDQNLRGSWGKVSVAARKTAPSALYRFLTRSGRRITTTGDHNIITLKDGRITTKRGSETVVGDFLPLPRITSEPNQPIETLDLITLFKDDPSIYVAGAAPFLLRRAAELKKLKINSRFDRYIYKYKQGRLIPISYFLRVLSALHASHKLPELLPDLSVASCPGTGRLPAKFQVSEALGKIMGYLVSEGTLTPTHAIITNYDPGVLVDAKKALETMGVSYFNIKSGVVISSRVFVRLLRVLGVYGKSHEKSVPPLLYTSRKKIAAAFLSAYFDGDGGVEHASIQAVSKSEKLISELCYLLYPFGIIGRIKSCKKKVSGSHTYTDYWKLAISGQENIRKFNAEINFVSALKRERLAGISGRDGNTNVDVIPGIAPVLKEIYADLPGIYPSSYAAELMNGKKNPSRAALRGLIDEIEGALEHRKNLSLRLETIDLPPLTELVKHGKENRRTRRILWQELSSSWALIQRGAVKPRFENVRRLIEIVEGKSYNISEVKGSLRDGFRELGLSLKNQDASLQAALYDKNGNTSYEMLWEAARAVQERHQKYQEGLRFVREKLALLKTLAASELFWDPITSIEKIEDHKETYVYDLCVDNEVFLAGRGGLFIHNSYLSKLEILRSLMWDTDVIVIDPEREYEYLSEAVGGSFINISLTSKNHINPFDLPVPREDESAADVLRSNIVNIIGLFRLMLGGLTPEEDAMLDQAISETYASRDITPDSDFSKINTPTLSDLELVLASTAGGENLAMRLKKFTTGSWAGFVNHPTNIEISNRLVIFSVRDMEEELRPVGIFLVLKYIWNVVRTNLKKRILVVDEAWWLMKNEDGASFLFGIAKRSRKYYLGVTTITQDVGDFLGSPYGKPIITNSSIQILMKQSPATIDLIVKTFNLSEEEKFLLLESERGDGIFFAGLKHVAMKVVASYTEDQIITSDPAQLLLIRKAKEEYAKQNV